MDIKKALEILEINNNELTLKTLKKNYHRLALQKHPDKNGNTYESNETFKEINEAYHYLKREIKTCTDLETPNLVLIEKELQQSLGTTNFSENLK